MVLCGHISLVVGRFFFQLDFVMVSWEELQWCTAGPFHISKLLNSDHVPIVADFVWGDFHFQHVRVVPRRKAMKGWKLLDPD